MIGTDIVVSDGCNIQDNVALYRGAELAYAVFCGQSRVFTNVINPRANVEPKDEFRPTKVGFGASAPMPRSSAATNWANIA